MTMTSAALAQAGALKTSARREPLVAAWLFAVAALVFVMILVGGATRLTDSGLSITEWRPVSGALPPLSAADWASEFAKYRETTEYRVQNAGMSLAEFQRIYWWEWGHRLLGRVIGLAFAAPFLVLLLQGRLKGRVAACLGLFLLGGVQGAVGWWMVQSGLTDRVDVEAYRLATHLGVAFVLLGGLVALALDAAGWPRSGASGFAPRLAWAFLGLLFLQVLAGAAMAGSHAGRLYANWPTIAGEWLPAQYAINEPFWRNLFENPLAIQFNHRTLGYGLAAFGLFLGWLAYRRGAGPARGPGVALGVLALAQTMLGIVTVVNAAPLDLSLAHQGLGAALWLAAVVAVRAAHTAR